MENGPRKTAARVDRFFAASQQAKEILASSPAEWQRLARADRRQRSADARILSQPLCRRRAAPAARRGDRGRARALPGARDRSAARTWSAPRWSSMRPSFWRPARVKLTGGSNRAAPRLASSLMLAIWIARRRSPPGRACCRRRWRSPRRWRRRLHRARCSPTSRSRSPASLRHSLLAMAGGIALGILMGRSRTADELLDLPVIVRSTCRRW